MHKLMMILFFCSLLISCNQPENVENLVVASSTVDCIGVGPQKCLLVKSEGETDWTFLYSGIEGFNYQPGYEYLLKVRKEEVENPAADQSSIRYVLVKEISREMKTSENMPLLPL
ncbi:MAG: DUF4377 domain-containing protein [Tannerellaceae bacterium]|nr:DUF4377 domain-containing protein [Tannerellaceae bacterium]